MVASFPAMAPIADAEALTVVGKSSVDQIPTTLNDVVIQNLLNR